MKPEVLKQMPHCYLFPFSLAEHAYDDDTCNDTHNQLRKKTRLVPEYIEPIHQHSFSLLLTGLRTVTRCSRYD